MLGAIAGDIIGSVHETLDLLDERLCDVVMEFRERHELP